MRQPITSAATEPDDDSAVAPLHAARPAIAAASEQRQGFAAVLRRRDFRYLWGAQLASQLADKFLMFTLLVFMYTLTKRASLQSVLMIAYTLPSVLLSAAAGVYADRHDKRALMIGTNVARAGLILLIPIAQLFPPLRGQAWPLIVVTLLFSSAGQIFAPAEAASIPKDRSKPTASSPSLEATAHSSPVPVATSTTTLPRGSPSARTVRVRHLASSPNVMSRLTTS